MSSGKSPGVDNLSGEHLKYAGDRLPFLFTPMFVHGYMPRDVVKSVAVPVVKAKTRSIRRLKQGVLVINLIIDL